MQFFLGKRKFCHQSRSVILPGDANLSDAIAVKAVIFKYIIE